MARFASLTDDRAVMVEEASTDPVTLVLGVHRTGTGAVESGDSICIGTFADDRTARTPFRR